MKHIILLGDGMADLPYSGHGNKTILQYSHTPYMDFLASNGRTGMLKTIPDGFHPGSEVANSSILGYDQNLVYEGRGPLEAASMGVDLEPGDLAFRCNLVCLEGGNIKNHSCGGFSAEETRLFAEYLNEHLGSDRVSLHAGVSYRNLLVIKGGDKRVDCTPPHDIPGQSWQEHMVRPAVPEAAETADLLNSLILASMKLLESYPLNMAREERGMDRASCIWPWAGGYRPQMKPLRERFPQIGSGAVISAVDLIRGIGKYAGLRNIEVPGATGMYDTDYHGKVSAALEALQTDDFVFLHVEASDEAGHEGDRDLKQRTIEDFDRCIVGPMYEAVKDWEEPVAIAVLPDHPTPVQIRTHTSDPVPFLIWARGIEPDCVGTFDEQACRKGVFGLLQKDEFINEFMSLSL